MAKPYEPKTLEAKWQETWRAQKTFQADVQSAKKPKHYVLDMFPYPSGAGPHVGHPLGYFGTDIFAKWKMLNGYEVLHPMGWDAFGLPAENYAIKVGVHPALSTAENVKNFKRQMQMIGLGYDWEKEVNTSAPDYYQWTQWLFLELYHKGLAYKKHAPVNWCETCQTVLANEQVIDGKCERSKDPVIQKELEQWFFKVTDYAEELLSDLVKLDWPEKIKLMQSNWVGKSEGATLSFAIQNGGTIQSPAGQQTGPTINVFTTRPDTLYGATYLVLSPEHPLVPEITTPAQRQAVELYQEFARRRQELERTGTDQEKTGVFTGAYAIHPLTQEALPIWIADYVLMGYGTGAIMAVPAHDERDFVFAKQFALPIKTVIAGGADGELYTGAGTLVNSEEFNGLDWQTAKIKITKAVQGEMTTTYKLRDWLISRQRYWGAPIPIVYDPQGQPHPVPQEHLPWLLPTDVEFKPTGESPLRGSKEFIARTEQIFGKGWRPEFDTMDTFVCSSWYYLRYPSTGPQMAADKPFDREVTQHWLPVDVYVGGAEHAVLHLLYARFITKALRDMGHIHFDEPFTRLVNQGLILAEDGRKMSKSLGNVINPDDIVNEYGADTLRLYEMFMGPFQDSKPWSTASIKGVRRFLEKVWNLYQKPLLKEDDEAIRKLLHKTIKKVGDDIERFSFNTSVSAMMIFVNAVSTGLSKDSATAFLSILAPFAPHLAEELWQGLGHKHSIFQATWPAYDPACLKDDTITLVLQVNNKVRDNLTVMAGLSQDEALLKAMDSVNVQRHVAGQKPKKVIYVKDRLINIIV